MKNNARAMVFSSFAADALALGPHWIYDTTAIERKFGRVDKFLPSPEGSFHPGKRAGDFTHYGDQALLLLESIADNPRFDPHLFAESWLNFMKSYNGYMDKATKLTLEASKNGGGAEPSGSSSTDLGGASRICPIVYAYRNNSEGMVKAAREQTAITHDNPLVIDAAEFFARVALKTLDGTSPPDAFEQVTTENFRNTHIERWVHSGIESASVDTQAAILKFGQMCDINGAFPAVIHLIFKYENDLKTALIENTMAGGDSAARGMLAGMVSGAFLGSEALPAEWLSGINAFDRISSALDIIDKINK